MNKQERIANAVEILRCSTAIAVKRRELERRFKGCKPSPRLKHIKPGQAFTTKTGSKRDFILLRKDEVYGYVKDGKISLCEEIRDSGMAFEKGGWRVI